MRTIIVTGLLWSGLTAGAAWMAPGGAAGAAWLGRDDAAGAGSAAAGTTPVALVYPSTWPAPLYKGPLTQEGIALGRKLFYDPRLSKDSTISCASCHEQYAAFATFDHSLSHGYNNTLTTRNAPALQNLAWQKAYMWDGRIPHLEDQPAAPITGSNEMGETLQGVLAKLKKDRTYRQMFAAAKMAINEKTLGNALSQFMVCLISSDSKYDKVKRGQATFTLPERLGYAIFQQKCSACHPEPFFTDGSYRNISMTLDTTLNDVGRMKVTGRKEDSLAFKVPSLRNVVLTFPYGHDGRYPDIRTVLERYHLTNYEIGQLKAFLYTLTDSTFIKDPRFSAPG
ncbi:cytochrome-c peroxidase [Dinghuibacter silviterrae]|uniref:Cytochrome c peroxidase n=1 Tax=Dinghuibacter silviterrae TaxID=1539049 RepID=A0A4V3GKK9_9BACT|nr:cytochrome-c peroxidase [Dinghuibacter silviterrae]TDW96062.1 cytochrome c peroxidase [Dinghuibacter silviterrae]